MTPQAIAATAPSPAPDIEASKAYLKRYVELLSMLSSRTLRTRYRGSVLGIFWSLSNPILMTGVYSLIFGTAFSKYYDNSIFNYIFATFVGLTTLNLFSQTTSQALGSVVNNGSLLNKVRLPVSLFPMSFVASNFFQFSIGALPVLALITLYKTHSLLHVVALLIPCLALLLTTVGFSLLTSALYVYFRDLPYMYEIVLFIVTMTSPIFYPMEFVPARVQPFLSINPLVFMVDSLRQIALVHAAPDLVLAGKGILSGMIYLAIGYIVFSSRRRDFMDLL